MNDLRENIESLLKERDYFNPDFNREEHCEELSDEIMSLISQHSENKGEKLVGKIFRSDVSQKWWIEFNSNYPSGFDSEQEAIAFCNRFNLKIKGEA